MCYIIYMSDDETKKDESLEAARDDSAESDDVVEFEFNDDPEPLSSDGAGGEEIAKKFKKLKNDLKQVQKEKQEYLLGWQKERADFANYKKEEENRKVMFSEAVRERILSRFLNVIDSFNMAFANKDAWEKVEEGWRKGVEYIYNQMNTIFEEYGVKEVGEVGEVFDPNLHHSIEGVPTEKKEQDHKIAEVVQKGYKLGERILRPAGVKVYEFKTSP